MISVLNSLLSLIIIVLLVLVGQKLLPVGRLQYIEVIS